jgi:hypothetical protein
MTWTKFVNPLVRQTFKHKTKYFFYRSLSCKAEPELLLHSQTSKGKQIWSPNDNHSKCSTWQPSCCPNVSSKHDWLTVHTTCKENYTSLWNGIEASCTEDCCYVVSSWTAKWRSKLVCSRHHSSSLWMC